MKRKQRDIITPELQADAEDMLAFIDQICSEQVAEANRMREAAETPAIAPEPILSDCEAVSDTNGSHPDAVLAALFPVTTEKLLEEIGNDW
jgi:hypothetical protein